MHGCGQFFKHQGQQNVKIESGKVKFQRVKKGVYNIHIHSGQIKYGIMV